VQSVKSVKILFLLFFLPYACARAEAIFESWSEYLGKDFNGKRKITDFTDFTNQPNAQAVSCSALDVRR
jgi:hypothetical protein